MKRKILWSTLLVILSSNCFSQDLPEPQMTDHTEVGPPPPGLVVVIDENSHLLLAAGIILGIFIIKKKKK